MLVGATGLHQEDQKLIYKEKERDSKAFLDVCGVKDRSKILLQEDPISQEKRLVELRKNAKLEKASKSISQISLEVDRLAGQVNFFTNYQNLSNFHSFFVFLFLSFASYLTLTFTFSLNTHHLLFYC